MKQERFQRNLLLLPICGVYATLLGYDVWILWNLKLNNNKKNHQFEILFTFQPREDIQTLNFFREKRKILPILKFK